MPAWARLLTVPRGIPELRSFLGRALTEVRELEHGALTLWEAAPALRWLSEEVSHLRVPLGSRLVRRFGDLRLGGQLPCFDGPMAEEIDREGCER
jgi:hypothetical protein